MSSTNTGSDPYLNIFQNMANYVSGNWGSMTPATYNADAAMRNAFLSGVPTNDISQIAQQFYNQPNITSYPQLQSYLQGSDASVLKQLMAQPSGQSGQSSGVSNLGMGVQNVPAVTGGTVVGNGLQTIQSQPPTQMQTSPSYQPSAMQLASLNPNFRPWSASPPTVGTVTAQNPNPNPNAISVAPPQITTYSKAGAVNGAQGGSNANGTNGLPQSSTYDVSAIAKARPDLIQGYQNIVSGNSATNPDNFGDPTSFDQFLNAWNSKYNTGSNAIDLNQFLVGKTGTGSTGTSQTSTSPATTASTSTGQTGSTNASTLNSAVSSLLGQYGITGLSASQIAGIANAILGTSGASSTGTPSGSSSGASTTTASTSSTSDADLAKTASGSFAFNYTPGGSNDPYLSEWQSLGNSLKSNWGNMTAATYNAAVQQRNQWLNSMPSSEIPIIAQQIYGQSGINTLQQLQNYLNQGDQSVLANLK